MRINNNLMAMNTHRQLGVTNNMSSKSMEKLSSGLRINRAGDDAAGLAISEKMRGQIRGLNQASRNSQDAISLIQTAEGALNETQAILQRMRELAVQASTDTNTGIDRGEIQKEINQLTSEINRIGNTTEFNTKTLLNGDLSATYQTAAATSVDVTKAVDATIQIGTAFASWSGGTGDDSTTDFQVGFTGTAANGLDWSAIDNTAANTVTVTRDESNSTFLVDVTANDGTYTLSVDAEAMVYDASTDTYSYDNHGISFSFTGEDAADWEDSEAVTFDLTAGVTTGTTDLTLATVESQSDFQSDVTNTGDGASTIGDITVTSADVLNNVDNFDVAWDGTDLTVTLKSGADTVSVTSMSLASGNTVTFAENGISFDFTADEGSGGQTASGSFTLETATTSVDTGAATTEDRSLAFQVGANEGQSMSLGIEDMRAEALGISSTSGGSGFSATDDVTNDTATEYALNVTTKEDASAAITTIQSAIDSVSTERSKLGAVQNRLEHTIKNLDTSSENLQASESRIRDVDMAKEMMEFTKNNILQQAAQAMLAQANQAPQGVLQLLR